jgi:hypothetical protein
MLIKVFQSAIFSSKKKILRCAQNDNSRSADLVPPISFRRMTEEKSNGRIVILNGVKDIL